MRTFEISLPCDSWMLQLLENGRCVAHAYDYYSSPLLNQIGEKWVALGMDAVEQCYPNLIIKVQ